jgi:transposase
MSKENEEVFKIILDFYFENGGTYEKLANEFKVSMATIERWRNGKSWPEEKAREIIVKRMLDFDMENIEKSVVN